MDLKDILERNGMSSVQAFRSELSVPVSPFFLQHDFVLSGCRRGNIPEDITAMALQYAEKVRKHRAMKTLAWHLYRDYCLFPEFEVFPEHIDIAGKDTGLLYLLVALSIYPHIVERLRNEGLPLELAEAPMSRFTPLLKWRPLLYPGEYGLLSGGFGFQRNFVYSQCFRLGRFDFIMGQVPDVYPELFRRCSDGRYITLCRKHWFLSDKLIPVRQDSGGTPVFWQEDKKSVSGMEIDSITGQVTGRKITLSNEEYERVLPDGTIVLQIHIPGGGGMSPEICRSTFQEAEKFFSTFFPDIKIGAAGCISWICNPLWRKLLPGSNLTKLQLSTLSFPFVPVPDSGLRFVFNRNDEDYDTYTAVNSLEKAMLEGAKNNQLCSAGFLLPWSEVKNFPLQIN